MPSSLPAVLVAIALFALLATFVEPSIRSSDKARLDAATRQLAALIKITQAEAIRKGQLQGISFDNVSGKFIVEEVNTATVPYTPGEIVYHPVQKQPLTWITDNWIDLSPSNNVFNYGTFGSANYLVFDVWGTPFLPTAGTPQQLATTNIVLNTGNHTRTITIDAVNGRVTVL